MGYNGVKLVVVCVDGGVPGIVTTWNFFSPHRRLPGVVDSLPAPLRSVFPSSTAPGHASFLTGTEADGHGIVANRFWEGEPVAQIKRLDPNPFKTLHPYESHSLQTPSLIDWFVQEKQVRVSAVHFPHTFSRADAHVTNSSVFCLYAPARSVRIPLSDLQAASAPLARDLLYFDEAIPLRICKSGGSGDRIAISLGATTKPAVITNGETVQISADIAVGRLSLPIRYSTSRSEAELDIGTAVLTLRFGEFGGSESGPTSLERSYTANPDVNFSEAPNAWWVCQEVLAALEKNEPDVLFVRFNQVDHAQEFLYWHATQGDGRTAQLAREQILDTYQLIDDCLGRIITAVGPDADYLLFSDHGIDYVDRRIRPNVVLAQLGLSDRMIFQGDSRVSYLYADEPVSSAVLDRIVAEIARVEPSARRVDSRQARNLRVPPASGKQGRTGQLMMMCDLHHEFVYGETGLASQSVQSASHGYLPSTPSMYGFTRMFGPNVANMVLPGSLTEASGVVKALWDKRSAVRA
jgi:predicted AlkP superfamily pyrophosphatase or phosphodiesterase